jgi:hypothetical protein
MSELAIAQTLQSLQNGFADRLPLQIERIAAILERHKALLAFGKEIPLFILEQRQMTALVGNYFEQSVPLMLAKGPIIQLDLRLARSPYTVRWLLDDLTKEISGLGCAYSWSRLNSRRERFALLCPQVEHSRGPTPQPRQDLMTPVFPTQSLATQSLQ